MADPTNSRDNRPTRGDQPRPGAKRASDAKIEAVSGLLAARKSMLDRPSAPAKLNLPELSRSIDEVVRRPKVLPIPRSQTTNHPISLDPTRVILPESSPVDGSKGFEHPREEESRSGKAAGENSSLAVAVGLNPTQAVRSNPSASLPVQLVAASIDPTPVGKEGALAPSTAAGIAESPREVSGTPGRPDEAAMAGSRFGPTTVTRVASGGLIDPGRLGPPPVQRGAGSVPGFAGRPDPISSDREGQPTDRGLAEAVAKVAVVDRPRVGEGEKTPPGLGNSTVVRSPVAGLARSGIMADHPSNSPIDSGSPMNLVRNPLSSNPGGFSTAGPADPGQGDSPSSRSGFDKGLSDDSSHGSTSSQVGASVDLARTNDLLQQLIDAVRKQRGSSLPPGGGSVHPDR